MLDDRPEEDKLLEQMRSSSQFCVHDWCDLYNGSGQDKHDRNIALATFFCKKCLDIRIKAYNQSRFKNYDDV